MLLLAPGGALPDELFRYCNAAVRAATLWRPRNRFCSREQWPGFFRRRLGRLRPRPLVRAQGRYSLQAVPF